MIDFDPREWHLDTHEIILSSTILMFNVFGIFGNTNFIWATLRNKELRNKHGLLMMWFCVYHNICLLSELFYISFNLADSTILRSTCYHYAFVHIIAICEQACLSLIISIDLLIAMIYPFQHRIYSSSNYVMMLMFPSWIYSLSMAIWGWVTVDNTALPFCNPPLAFSQRVGEWWVGSNILINCLTIFVYSVLFIMIMRNGNRTRSKVRRVHSDIAAKIGGKTVQMERRVLRSLSVVIAVYVFSWFAYILGNSVIRDIGLDTKTQLLVQSYMTIFALICHSQNYYVTFILSQSYRRAFVEQLYLIMCREIPEKFWPRSATASRQASQYWQRTRSEICIVGGTITPHNNSIKSLLSKRRTSSLPELSKLSREEQKKF